MSQGLKQHVYENLGRTTKFVVFDVTDPSFYAGKLSQEFTDASSGGEKPWFFQPADWTPNACTTEWYGSIAHTRTRVLMAYSHGHLTREQAQQAADEWQLDVMSSS